MGKFDNIRKFFGAGEGGTEYDEPYDEEQGYDEGQEDYYNENPPKRGGGNNVLNINATTQLQVVLVKPERFSEGSEVADHLGQRRTVVVNFETTKKEVARRLLDFLSGVVYSFNGKISRVATNIYIVTPYNVDIVGDELLGELENSGLY
ncbi:MAG: cell division protein SepF [Oscillospiraceae bacterium]